MSSDRRQFLRSKLALKGITFKALAKNIGISYIALYRKIRGTSHFTVPEVSMISYLLDLSAAEMNYIFFDLEMS